MQNLFILLFLLLLSPTLFATQLQSNYFIQSDVVKLSDIIPNPKEEIELFTINKHRHTKRVKTKELLKTLQKLGYKKVSAKHNYIQFTKKSPINTALIRLAIQNNYLKAYPNIKILSISVAPRSYMEKLPKEYEVVLNKKAYLKSHSTLYIKTLDRKKIFFNYTIKAKLNIIKAKVAIKKGDELSHLNTKNDSIMLDKFQAMPLLSIKKSTYEAKHKIKADSILTSRDVVGLFLIKRGNSVNVTVVDANIALSFTAKAKQNGRLGETITLLNSYGKKIKATVVGKNRAEIR